MREAVRAASDKPDEAFKWVQEVYERNATMELLRETDNFLTLDTKIRQVLKAGWTAIGGNPAAKLAHFPKTFRTPAPKFPRHRIRTTWGFKDEVWSRLEDSVNIDELEGIYGEVPEGTIASVTLFALPEGRRPTAMSSLTRFLKPEG